MNEATLNRLLSELEPLADKLGQGAEYVWEAAYRQVYVDAIGMVLFAIVCVALAGLTWRFRAIQLEKAENASAYEMSDHRVGASIMAMLTVMSIVMSGTFLVLALMRFANPVFYAIKSLMSAIGA